jgi:hypothetical protein
LSNDVISLALAIDKKVNEKKEKLLSTLYKTEAFDVMIFSVENMSKVYLTKSKIDSPEYTLAERMNHIVSAAKESLYENMRNVKDSDDD